VSKNEVLRIVQEERNILRKIKRREANWVGHIQRRNWIIKHVIDGRIVTGRRRR
jgi:hypothetical protein